MKHTLYQKGKILIEEKENRILFQNSFGSLSFETLTGQFEFRPSLDQCQYILRGRTGIETLRHQYFSGGHRPIFHRLESELQPHELTDCIGIHFWQQLSDAEATLHWRVRAYDAYYSLEVGVSHLPYDVTRFVSLAIDSFPASFGACEMLCLAYCSAHTGSPLSASRMCTVSPDAQLVSWWASAFFSKLGTGIIAGYLSALHYVGKAEFDKGSLRFINFAELKRGDTKDVLWSEPLYLAFASEPLAALEHYASQVAAHMGARCNKEVICGWGSWAHYHDNIDEKLILQNAAELSDHFSAKNIKKLVQIDHGWDERIALHRPETTWQARTVFSHDISSCLTQLSKFGNLNVGLWITPFAVNVGSRMLAQHYDYLVRNYQGEPQRMGGKGQGYCIDPTHPDGEQWLRDLFCRLKKWGVSYFKLDYLRCLLAPEPDDPHDGLDQIRVYWSGATRVEAYRRGLEIIRETVGDAVYLLACGAPTLPGAGLIDGQRIGQDIVPEWDNGYTGIRDCARNIACNFFWHGRVWQNDPDYLVIAPDLNLQRFWSTAVALCGGSMILSADLMELPDHQKHLLGSMFPPWGKNAIPHDLGVQPLPNQWRLSLSAHDESYFVVALFNWDEQAKTWSLQPSDFDWSAITERYVAIEFWSMTYLGETSRDWQITVPGRDVALICVRAVLKRPQLLASSLHYTMGAVELQAMNWSAADLTLNVELSGRGTSSGELLFRIPEDYELITPVDCKTVIHDNQLTVFINELSPRIIRLSFRSKEVCST